MGKNKGSDMNTTQTAPTIWVILFMEKGKEKANFNGVTDRSMMVSGKTIKKRAVESGKGRINYLM